MVKYVELTDLFERQKANRITPAAATAPAKADDSTADDSETDRQTNEADGNHCDHCEETYNAWRRRLFANEGRQLDKQDRQKTDRLNYKEDKTTVPD